ncbi:hypothetical protein [Streptomyces sp. HB132]|uniref:hypothetical protein n=1 Tax=Streptomyces sp. HB132 TaxID=767388 RepID=UPI001961527E|nr:hypothetical protein [Streptomyces sp. HB132]MBM7440870.1 acetyl-CoA carboxylase carboxyltransferase component [Streptomyces sp. HB132]
MTGGLHGGAYIVEDSQSTGVDPAFGWPAEEIAVAGTAGVVLRCRTADAEGPDGTGARSRVRAAGRRAHAS